MRRAFDRPGIVAAGLDQFLQRILLVDRHQHVAQVVAHRVQRDRQHDADLVAGPLDLGHDAGGRERDAALGQRHAVAVGGDQQGLLDLVEIVERLAHAHHHDVGDLAAFAPARVARRARRVAVGEVAEPVARHQQLGEDFLGGQVAHQLLRAGVAERAGERAADLAGDAERAAAFLGDVDGLDLDRAAGAAGGKRNSHLRVPSTEICSATISGRSMVKCCVELLRACPSRC